MVKQFMMYLEWMKDTLLELQPLFRVHMDIVYLEQVQEPVKLQETGTTKNSYQDTI